MTLHCRARVVMWSTTVRAWQSCSVAGLALARTCQLVGQNMTGSYRTDLLQTNHRHAYEQTIARVIAYTARAISGGCADLGLGVNAGLVDVGVLFEVLEEHSNDVPAALLEYERLRRPEHAALVRIMQARSAPRLVQRADFGCQSTLCCNVARVIGSPAPCRCGMPSVLSVL